jgi:hypothetical protein
MDKKATIGTTMTWIIATIIIIIILLVFLFGASLLAGFKKVQVAGGDLFVSSDYTLTDKWLNTKSAMAYLITSDRGNAEKWAERHKLNLEEYVK